MQLFNIPSCWCFVRFRALFPFLFWVFVHILSLFTTTSCFLEPFLCIFRVIISRVLFLLGSGFLTAQAPSGSCCSHGVNSCAGLCVGGQCWCQGDFFLPCHHWHQPAHPAPRGTSCSLPGRLPCPPSLLPAHPQIYTMLSYKKSHVSAGTVIACCLQFCMDFLQGFPQ